VTAERFRWLVLPALALACGACGSSSNNVVAPSLSASCAATPSSGPAPLLVRFSLDVGGAEGSFSVSIDYGDGGSGSDAAAPHTYANAGSFTATFRVATASQSAQCSTVVQAAPHAPPPTPPPPTGPNQAPNAVFRTTPLPDDTGRFVSDPSSDPPLVISFNMCRTSDPEGDPLLFRMDLDGDGQFEQEGSNGADCRHSYEYDVPGIYAPRICVTDLSPQSLSPRHGFQCQSYVVEILDSEAESRRRGAAHVAPRR
jgi:hypothetical protein